MRIKLVWKMSQDYQLTLMISMKIRILKLTNIDKRSRLVALIFNGSNAEGMQKTICIKLLS